MIFNRVDKLLNVFILAAGLGKRLLPITNHIPKPLLPVLGKPVLQSVLEKVSALPVNETGINLYHKRVLVEKWVEQSAFSKTVRLFPEETLLGTGGALKNAQEFLSGGTFMVHNSDIVTDIDLIKLLEVHLSSENLVTLAVHNCPKFNNLNIDKKSFLKEILTREKDKDRHSRPVSEYGINSSGNPERSSKDLDSCFHGNDRGKQQWQRLGFTGIAVYEPEFLKFLSTGVSSVVDAWINAVNAGQRVGTLDFSGCLWGDIGTPSSYFSAVFHALRADGETLYIHPSVTGCKEVILDGCVVIEKGSILSTGVSLKNCIILPESQLESGLPYENCILGPGFKIDLRESDISGESGDGGALLIGTGGSDRKYFRVKRGENTAVLMQCSDSPEDYQRHIEYTRFFLKQSVPVPELIETNPDNMTALFEDLGDISLYSWLRCTREKEQIEKMYRHVIDILILIHTNATKYVSECPFLKNRVFDYEYFRWETGYFVKSYVEGIRNIRVKNLSGLNKEFHRLALKAGSFSRTVIHRDFQSQNIMIAKGEAPRLIDYQGARLGPPAYDVASILWDPYYRLTHDVRENLLSYYLGEMTKKAGDNFIKKDFMDALLLCRLQRHMQALGAYGFLSHVKGKKYFLKYVPEGLRLLKKDISGLKKEYPLLYRLVTET
ncbi:MAG: sugar phosphate nucleotidyltransferase [Thermodesulfovibrionia bacterium]